MTSAMINAEVELPSRIDSMLKVEAMIDDIGSTLGLNEDVRANMLVAVSEAVKNAIELGNKNDQSKSVSLKVDKRDSEIVFTVRDQGTGFDFNNIADPTAPENIEKITGRGIFLMRALADKVDYSNGGNTVAVHFAI
jgi:serine/threonine-protein kinase RsbW